jgi:nicotinate-nucleotide adenylyltransferase
VANEELVDADHGGFGGGGSAQPPGRAAPRQSRARSRNGSIHSKPHSSGRTTRFSSRVVSRVSHSYIQRAYVAMTELAIAGEPGFAISLADAPKPAGRPNYTVETLQQVRKELPAVDELYCLMGADSFIGLRLWHRAAEIPFVAPLIVASRPGQSLSDLKALLPAGLTMELSGGLGPAEGAAQRPDIDVRCYTLQGQTGRVARQRTQFYLLPGLNVDISASQIREMARAESGASEGSGAAGHELLPDAVFDYVRSHGLYR